MSSDAVVGSTFPNWRSYFDFARRVKSSTRYIFGDEDQLFLKAVLKTISDRECELKKGHLLYRAQLGVDWIDRVDTDGNWIGEDVWGYSSDRMKPLRDRARQGRANSTGIPALYVANTVETAISEVRPWIGAEVSVATVEILRPLRTLDLSVAHGRSSHSGLSFRKLLGEESFTPEEIERAVWTDIDNAFSQPVTQSDDRADYAPTQILAELFRNAGYEAIGYKSHFGDSEKGKGYNIVIFDLDAVDVVKCAPYAVSSIKIEAHSTGNPWFKQKK